MLGLLFGKPQRDYTIGELIELADSGSGAVQRELQRLVDSGLVMVHLSGRQKRYQANPSSPIFEEICSIIRKTSGPAERIRAVLLPLDERIELALLYGSVAKHTDRADSDIDVLVVSDTLTLEELLEALGTAESSLRRTIQPTLYTLQEFNSRRVSGAPFLRKVLDGDYILLKGSLDGSGRTE